MQVALNHYTPLVICSDAIRTCWQSQDKSDCGGEIDRELIDRVGNKFKHGSTLEHLVYNFSIDGVSRALLQEFARHRMASLSVKSTRFTIKELKSEPPFVSSVVYDSFTDGYYGTLAHDGLERAKEYLVMTGNNDVDINNVIKLDMLRTTILNNVSNDIAKYELPEAYKTDITWTVNARSLQNVISLRSDKSALWEFRQLVEKIYEALPDDHKYLFKNHLKTGE